MARPRMTQEMAEEAARKDFRTEIKIRRVQLDMTQRELAGMVGVSPPVMSELLANPDKMGLGRLRKIVKALQLDPMIVLQLLGYSLKDIRKLQESA